MRRTRVALFSALALGAPFCAFLGLPACYGNVADDSPGDPPVDAGPPSALGAGTPLSVLIPTTEPDGGPNPDHPAPDASVYITGTSLIVIDSFDETQDGKSIGAVYVQDIAPAPTAAKAKVCGACVPPNSGVQLYKPNYSPPNLLVAPGDVLDLTGLYQDYAYTTFKPGYSFPEIYEPVVTFRFEYTAPAPTIIPIADMPDPLTLAEFEVGHQWLGMLVEIDDVTIGYSEPDGKGRQALYFTYATGPDGGLVIDNTMNAPNISNELFDLDPAEYGCPVTPLGVQATTQIPILGACTGPKAHLSKLIGVVTFFFNFHVAPRSAADLVR
jgi:hypothetical protein